MRPLSSLRRAALAAACGLLCAACAWWLLLWPPPLALDRSVGLYAPEGTPTFRWTGGHAALPLRPGSGSTLVRLTLATQTWPGRPETLAAVLRAGQTDASLFLDPRGRRVTLLLPAAQRELVIETPVARPPGDYRYLGAQLFAATALTTGAPLRELGLIALAALLGGALGWCCWPLVRAGHGGALLLTLLALVLRLWALDQSPPGPHRDEVVSTVDAWSLLQTGRDHLGQRWPLASFESYGDWISPLLTYLQLPMVALFGPHWLAARVVTALFGAALVPAVYAAALLLGHRYRSPEEPTPQRREGHKGHEDDGPVSRAPALFAALLAALLPWSVFLSRVAIPPALAPTAYALIIVSGLLLLRDGTRRAALWLALAAGLGLYAYPTLKLAAPLLAALTVLLALRAHGWRAARRWWPAAGLLALLWVPFLLDTLFNPVSGARFGQIGLQADSVTAWLAQWWRGYSTYLTPDLYYLSGDSRKIIRGVPGYGVALGAEAPLVLLGAGAACYGALRGDLRRALLLGAALIAPLAASLTAANPHTFRAAPLVPAYALLAGLGALTLWQWAARTRRSAWLPLGVTLALAAALTWQFSGYYRALLTTYPQQAALTWFYADREPAAMARVAARAAAFDEVWVDADSIGRPYIYLLAAQAADPSQVHATLKVIRSPGAVNEVRSFANYTFDDLSKRAIPPDLPVLEVIPERVGSYGYVLLDWQTAGRRILVVRGLAASPAPAEE